MLTNRQYGFATSGRNDMQKGGKQVKSMGVDL